MPNGYQGPETHNEEMLERQLSLANNHVRELQAELEQVKVERNTLVAEMTRYRNALGIIASRTYPATYVGAGSGGTKMYGRPEDASNYARRILDGEQVS